jgi:MYXO-CTERM domain-containing protein
MWIPGKALAVACLFAPATVLAAGVGNVMTSKAIPAATVAVIHPTTGASVGGGSTDIRVAPGDIISWRLRYFPVPDKKIRSVQGYLTAFVPNNLQVVGVRMLDENAEVVQPRYPGLAQDGCGGPCGAVLGSISQLYGDTGFFYASAANLTRNPLDAFITVSNGITIDPTFAPDTAVLISASSPYKGHNQWDRDQIHVVTASFASGWGGRPFGRGQLPHGFGSPVAGPGAHYGKDVTGATGPWGRIAYPGSLKAFGDQPSGPGNVRRMSAPTSDGHDLTPLNPLPVGTRAVRVAIGEVRVGEPGEVEVFFKVLGTPLDSGDGRQNADVSCGEVFGGDSGLDNPSATGNGAKNNPWSTYLPSPACVFLNLLFDLTTDKILATSGETVSYTLRGLNLSTQSQANVVVRLGFESSAMSLMSAPTFAWSLAGAPPSMTTESCSNLVGTPLAVMSTCLRWNLGTLPPGADYTVAMPFSVGGQGQVANVVRALYTDSDQPLPGFSTTAISIARPTPVLRATITSPLGSVAAGATVTLNGVFANSGSGDADVTRVGIFLPAGWTVTSSLNVQGAGDIACGVASPSNGETSACVGTFTLTPGLSRSFSVTVRAATGASQGLYPIHLNHWATQQLEGGDFETFFPDIVTLAVGTNRSDPPVVTCPITAGSTSVSGTTTEANGTVIRVFFDGVFRGQTVASSGVWTLSGFTNFGPLYGGVEVRATAEAPGELESERSERCLCEQKRQNGALCTGPSECASGICVDGVCCDTACGGNITTDCQACSASAGAATDGTCGPRANNATCDDGNACTQTDTCQSGACTGGNPVSCTAPQDECHNAGTCDPGTGACTYPQKSDGTSCSTGTCQGGSCQASGTGGTGGSAGASAGGSAGVSAGGSAGVSAGGSAGVSAGGSAGVSAGGMSAGGSGGSSTGGASTDGGSDAAGSGGSPSSSSDEGGCGCRTAGGKGGLNAAWLLVVLGLAAARRRGAHEARRRPRAEAPRHQCPHRGVRRRGDPSEHVTFSRAARSPDARALRRRGWRWPPAANG